MWVGNTPRQHFEWEYVVYEWVLAIVNAAFFLIACVGALLARHFGKKARFWWVAAIIAIPALCVLVLLLGAPRITGQ